MKKGFTMIELIFVIVILGTLAAVAIPKINATRDDAELAKATSFLSLLMDDFANYFISKGELSNNIKAMTSAPLVEERGMYYMPVKGKKCVKFDVEKDKDTITVSKNEMNETICKKLFEIDKIYQKLTTSYQCPKSPEVLSNADITAGCEGGLGNPGKGETKPQDIRKTDSIKFIYRPNQVLR